MVFLVNVGQSSDGRVSSVEPAVLIHIAVLQMARTVNWVPRVLTTVLTQQYPYGAFPAWEMAIVWSNTSVSPCTTGGAVNAEFKRAAFSKLEFFTACVTCSSTGTCYQTGCSSVTLDDLFVSKSLSFRRQSCLHGPSSSPVNYTRLQHVNRTIHWKYVSDTTLSVVHYSDLNYRQACAHTRTPVTV